VGSGKVHARVRDCALANNLLKVAGIRLSTFLKLIKDKRNWRKQFVFRQFLSFLRGLFSQPLFET
jgi:hypothetical protein